MNKANLRDLIAATGLVILLKFDPNHWFFSLCDLEIWWMILKIFRAPPLSNIKLCASFHHHSYSLETPNSGQNLWFFVQCDLEIWCITLENNMAPLLYFIKLCASLQNHGWIQTGVTVRKCPIPVKMSNFFVPCDLEIWWITLEYNRAPFLYYIKLCASFQSHGWIQTWVTVQKRSIRVKLAIFGPVWPWNLTDDLEKQ